ncbi:MAG TPA: hypothetical protein VFT28_08615, partial [Gemmatimonadales bacterium]|nr:hypothetical protein [Gemmatimonadales bacterium]
EREAAGLRLEQLRARQAEAVGHLNGVKAELARVRPDGGQIRFFASEMYRSVSLAEDAHQALMRLLQVSIAGRETVRLR